MAQITVLPPGTVTLLYGPPGVGKSTLVSQVISSAPQKRILYATCEEDKSLVEGRLQRLRTWGREDKAQRIDIIEECLTGRVIEQALASEAEILIVDGIHRLSEIRKGVDQFTTFARATRTTTFLLSASKTPVAVEHSVDVVFVLEPSAMKETRCILQCMKNRFGRSDWHALLGWSRGALQEIIETPCPVGLLVLESPDAQGSSCVVVDDKHGPIVTGSREQCLAFMRELGNDLSPRYSLKEVKRLG